MRNVKICVICEVETNCGGVEGTGFAGFLDLEVNEIREVKWLLMVIMEFNVWMKLLRIVVLYGHVDVDPLMLFLAMNRWW